MIIINRRRRIKIIIIIGIIIIINKIIINNDNMINLCIEFDLDGLQRTDRQILLLFEMTKYELSSFKKKKWPEN